MYVCRDEVLSRHHEREVLQSMEHQRSHEVDWRDSGGKTYIHTYIHTHTDIHTYIHAYTHTYVHTFIHTYIHTYIPTYLPTAGQGPTRLAENARHRARGIEIGDDDG